MKIVIVTGIAVLLGIICGSGSVYAFNHIPDEWLGTDEKGREWQRIKSVPWKYIFTATFIVIGIYLGIKDPQKAAGIYAASLMLTQIAMSGFLYGRIPRLIVYMLALTGAGIIPFTIGEDLGFGAGSAGMIKSHLAGAAAGFAIMLVLMVIKKFILKGSIDMALCELGMVLGLLQGIGLCLIFGWALKFVGMLIPQETLSETFLVSWFMDQSVLVQYLGI